MHYYGPHLTYEGLPPTLTIEGQDYRLVEGVLKYWLHRNHGDEFFYYFQDFEEVPPRFVPQAIGHIARGLFLVQPGRTQYGDAGWVYVTGAHLSVVKQHVIYESDTPSELREFRMDVPLWGGQATVPDVQAFIFKLEYEGWPEHRPFPNFPRRDLPPGQE